MVRQGLNARVSPAVGGLAAVGDVLFRQGGRALNGILLAIASGRGRFVPCFTGQVFHAVLLVCMRRFL